MGQTDDKNLCTLPRTEMLYYTFVGNSLTKCDSTVLHAANRDDGSVDLFLDKTVFHAQGGGQPTDLGKITLKENSDVQVNIRKVVQDRTTGVATHTGNYSKTGENDQKEVPGILKAGDEVCCEIDEDVRKILSECHTAGHVVDSAMARCGKFLKPSKAYHFLEGPYVEYEGSVPPEEREAFLKDLQEAFQQLVHEKIPIEIDLLSKEDADAVCNRQAQNFDMDIFADKATNQIRVVTVAGYFLVLAEVHMY